MLLYILLTKIRFTVNYGEKLHFFPKIRNFHNKNLHEIFLIVQIFRLFIRETKNFLHRFLLIRSKFCSFAISKNRQFDSEPIF